MKSVVKVNPPTPAGLEERVAMLQASDATKTRLREHLARLKGGRREGCAATAALEGAKGFI